MTGSTTDNNDPNAIKACTISRDVQNFDLLIEDMEALLEERWGDLTFEDALDFFEQPDASALEFIALAIDSQDEPRVEDLCKIIERAKQRQINVVLIAEEVTPTCLHQLLRCGADEFVPYPLPENELHSAVERLNTPPQPASAPPQPAKAPPQPAIVDTGYDDAPAELSAPTQTGNATIIVIHGIAGGSGATTFAVNLAAELSELDADKTSTVCLLDLDLQFGNASTYLDLDRRDSVYEMYADTESMDSEVFRQALQKFSDTLNVLTAPADMLPLDLVTPEDIQRVIGTASQHFDYVIIDMPSTLVMWSETVLEMAHIYMSTLELDMRSAQNALRFKQALQSEDLPHEKLRYVLNRSPKFTDLNGKARVKRMAESLDISIDLLLPDGGKQVAQSTDHGEPMMKIAPKNPLRKEFQKVAQSLHDLRASDTEAA